MKFAVVLLSAFALFVLAAASVDIVPAVRTWVGRIGVGRMSADTSRQKIRAVALRQLRKTPPVPVSDQTRFTLPERLRGTYRSAHIQAWQQAALLLGAQQAKAEREIAAFQATVLTPDGRWKQTPESTDAALLAYALLRATKEPETIRPAMDAMYTFLRGIISGGTIPYTQRAPQVRFVDTVGMVCPFLYLYGKIYDCPEAQTLCMAQLSEYAQKGLHPALYLPVHAFRRGTGAPLGIYGWGRGCGWYALALAELTRCGADVQVFAVPFADALLSVQQKNGAFSRQLFAEAGTESSATAMLGHFLFVQSAASSGAPYRAAAARALDAVAAVTRRDGTVDMAQGDTKGIGFYSMRLLPLPAAQGFAWLLSEELQ